MKIEVMVTLPDGHVWQGELEIDDADIESEPGEIDDDETRSYIFDCIAEWLIQEKIGWTWAVKPAQ